jgi:hypothetical protein
VAKRLRDGFDLAMEKEGIYGTNLSKICGSIWVELHLGPLQARTPPRRRALKWVAARLGLFILALAALEVTAPSSSFQLKLCDSKICGIARRVFHS